MFLSIFLGGCGANEVIVEKPVVVEVPGPVQHIPVPAEFLVIHEPATIPDSLTWAELAQLFTADRETIRMLNAQIVGIKSLNISE